MYSIFHPLDPNERLPRELIREGNRHRWVSGGWLFSLIGAFYLPALILAIIVLGSLHVSMSLAFAVGGLGLVAVYVYAIWGRTKP